MRELRDRGAALPGVDAAVSTDVAVLSGGHRSDGFKISGSEGKDSPHAMTDLYMTTKGYFAALGIPILAGRDFANEAANAPRVAVVGGAGAGAGGPGGGPSGRH